jgi:glycosyltransferase involved in cell wall biosynthesis
MIWLASYPRSGNTFFRNVLNDVYGIESSSFYNNVGVPKNYTDYSFVKTHHLPGNVFPQKDIPVVYLIRDGRDALVSVAHQRKDIHEPKSNFRDNLKEAIIAAENSYFGGWSKNVFQWLERADIVIFFEDLIKNPIKEIERIRTICDLPEANLENIPDFNLMKQGRSKYGRGERIAKNKKEQEEILYKSFRKGKVGGWKDDMDEEMHDLFWSHHRNAMEFVGYSYDNSYSQIPSVNLGKEGVAKTVISRKVLVEASKLHMEQNDGIKRYLSELLKALYIIQQRKASKWEIDLLVKDNIIPLKKFGKKLFDVNEIENLKNKKSTIFIIKKLVKLFLPEFLKIELIKLSHLLKRKFHQYLKKANLNTLEHLESNKPENNYDVFFVPLPQHYEAVVDFENENFCVVLHDITHKLLPEYHTTRNVNLSEKGINYFLNKKTKFIAVSKHTKEDFIKEYNVDSSQIDVIYESADNTKFKKLHYNDEVRHVRAIYGIPSKVPFIITVSTIEPRKNLINTIKAFEELISENPNIELNLVIVGRKGWQNLGIKDEKLRSRIFLTGFVDEDHLPILYNEALFLCYASFYEGFGLPLLEAMSCGTPIIYGDNSSMKELFSNYGLGVNPADVDDIKSKMLQLVKDDSLRNELAKKGVKRSFNFSWFKAANETIESFENYLKSR